MNKDWFEFTDIRKRDFSRASWIPLRSIQTLEDVGRYGYLGHREEIFHLTSAAFKDEDLKKAEALTWDNFSLMNRQVGYIEEGTYYPAEEFNEDGITGLNLVLEQDINQVDGTVWHLSQDLVIALRLLREGDIWVCPSEGYESAVRIKRDEENRPVLLEVKSKYLKDYLYHRGVSLVLSSYRYRREIADSRSYLDWPKDHLSDGDSRNRWDGRVFKIHEGGEMFGSSIAIFHAERIDVDPDEDVPILNHPTKSEFKTTTNKKTFDGRALFVFEGEFRRNETIEKGNLSPISGYDKESEKVVFTIESSGQTEAISNLKDSGRWLWFKPEVIEALCTRRSGKLRWYTAHTGSIAGSPESKSIHFGLNDLGLINVYAKDISFLKVWEQKIWASHNVAPEGGVSTELQDSQVRASPAKTKSPEKFLWQGIEMINTLSQKRFGFDLIRPHEEINKILLRTHRFRVNSREGLYSLAKEVARLTADSFNTNEIKKVIKLESNSNLGSLRCVEKLLSEQIGSHNARSVMGPLVGAYELRHGDAHLPSSEMDDSLALVSVNAESPFVYQGFQLLDSCVSSIFQIASILRDWKQSTD